MPSTWGYGNWGTTPANTSTWGYAAAIAGTAALLDILTRMLGSRYAAEKLASKYRAATLTERYGAEELTARYRSRILKKRYTVSDSDA